MKIHFISGLPRSGSTLLEGILRQNPRFHAAVSTPLADLFAALVRSMSGFNDASIFIGDAQRKRVLRGLVEAYYAGHSAERVFDTNRNWTAFLPAIAELFPEARMICCLRNPAWILDSIERQIQRNAVNAARMFGFDSKANVYTRVETLMGKDGFVRRSLGNLRQAWFGLLADRLIAIPYDSLTQRPAETMAALYSELGEPAFAHNFDHVEYDEPLFDSSLGLPGFHRVFGPVIHRTRETILPPDLFRQYDQSFWNDADQNPRAVRVL
ncbi:MAG: sulfotransferase [Acidobacteriota bacterium]|nr:sulfotransferase [Acidobacteriota bacterium]